MIDPGNRSLSRLHLPGLIGPFAVVLTVVFGMNDVGAESAGHLTLSGEPPILIAHRGASGYLPEHTLESYRRAIALGADFIEPDLVSTADGALIARHEPWLGDTTDVADHPAFANRKTVRVVDGRNVEDWFAGDFLLAEIKELRAKQAVATRDQSFNGMFEIPTFDEIIALAKSESVARGRSIGIYPETKHPSFHCEIGLPLEDALLDRLAREGWTEKTSPVIVQSFEVSNLQYIRTKSNIRLVQLIGEPDGRPYDFEVSGRDITYLEILQPAGFAEIAAYADGMGVAKDYVLVLNSDGAWQDSGLIPMAHGHKLFVHAYTFQDEERFRLEGFSGDALAEYEAFYAAGIDGVFSDFPDTAREALRRR